MEDHGEVALAVGEINELNNPNNITTHHMQLKVLLTQIPLLILSLSPSVSVSFSPSLSSVCVGTNPNGRVSAVRRISGGRTSSADHYPTKQKSEEWCHRP